jgi:hypothetical protein
MYRRLFSTTSTAAVSNSSTINNPNAGFANVFSRPLGSLLKLPLLQEKMNELTTKEIDMIWKTYHDDNNGLNKNNNWCYGTSISGTMWSTIMKKRIEEAPLMVYPVMRNENQKNNQNQNGIEVSTTGATTSTSEMEEKKKVSSTTQPVFFTLFAQWKENVCCWWKWQWSKYCINSW